MKGFLLDTNVLSEFSRGRVPNENVDRWMKEADDELLFVSVLTFGEILRGIELLPHGRRREQLEEWRAEALSSFAFRGLAVNRAIAERWAVLSVEAQQRGRPLANIDGLIAATAIEHELTLVTRNTKDFQGLGCDLFSPWAELD